MCECCERKHDADRRMWLALRRGLLAIVKAIEVRYPETDERRQDHRRAA